MLIKSIDAKQETINSSSNNVNLTARAGPAQKMRTQRWHHRPWASPCFITVWPEGKCIAWWGGKVQKEKLPWETCCCRETGDQLLLVQGIFNPSQCTCHCEPSGGCRSRRFTPEKQEYQKKQKNWVAVPKTMLAEHVLLLAPQYGLSVWKNYDCIDTQKFVLVSKNIFPLSQT